MIDDEQILISQQLYHDKVAYLNTFCDEVEPHDFYRDLFPLGSFQKKGTLNDGLGNGIAIILDKKGRKARGRVTVTDDLAALDYLRESSDLVITCPVSFFGKRAIMDYAHEVFGLAFDLDFVGMNELENLLYQMNQDVLPKASYLIHSGTGIHIYYIFKSPVPLQKSTENLTKIGVLKHALTEVLWNRYTSSQVEIDGKDARQYQGITHGYRIVGGPSKLGPDYPVKAYCFGDHIDYSHLIDFAVDCNKEKKNRTVEALTVGLHKTTPLAQAAEKWPDWYRRVVLGESEPEDATIHPGRWTVKRDLYDWWLRRIRTDATVGHRYFCIMCLAVFAVKCSIDKNELYDDAMGLVPLFNSMSTTDPFTQDDVKAALRAYEEEYVTFPRDTMSKLSGIPMVPNKRNGRTRAEHLARARAVQAVDYPNGEWRKGNGRPSAKEKVVSWRRLHPGGSKTQCKNDTALSYMTIRKWWESTAEEESKQYDMENGHIVASVSPDILHWEDELDRLMAKKGQS